MYLDAVVIFSLIVVILTTAVVVYIGIYAWRHIKVDVEIDSRLQQKDVGNTQDRSEV